MRLSRSICIANAGKGPQEQPPAEKAPRVNPNLNQSIRKQLAVARILSSPPPEPKEAVKTKFRRKKPSEEEQNEAAQKERDELAALAKKPRLPGLRSLYGSKGAPNPPIVLVDGYNVLLQWVVRVQEGHADGLPHLLQGLPPAQILRVMEQPMGFHHMRDRMLVELSQYSAWRDVKVMCAFDAVNNPFCSETKREMQSGIEVIYTADTDADRFLMAEAKCLRTLGAPKVLVASNDREVATACTGNEIFPVGALTLLKDMRKTENESNWRSLRVDHGSKTNLGESIYTPKNSVFKKVGYKPYARW